MSDNLLSVRARQLRAAEAAQAAEQEAAARRRRPWQYIPAEARASLLAVFFMFSGAVLTVVEVGLLVGLLTGSAAVGIAAGGAVLGLALFVIGVLLGLNS